MKPIVTTRDFSTALVAALLALATDGTAQEGPPSPGQGQTIGCQTPEHRQFDFWLGSWEVHNASGELVGRNEIRRVAGGCALLESWRGIRGSRGMSINTYDVDLGRWTQRWVGAGATLWLEGGVEDERMVLRGTRARTTPRGAVLDRISWTPLQDGRVRQLWEVSEDEGASWNAIFEGFYSLLSASDSIGNGEITIVRPAEPDWRHVPSGAAFATIHGRPSEPGPFSFLMRLPIDWKMPAHRHNTAEHISVLSGTLYMRFSQDGEAEELPAGSVVVVPPGHPMWAWTGEEETVIQVSGIGPFETLPVDQPGARGLDR